MIENIVVEGISKLLKKKSCENVTSKTFEFGGYQWCVQLFLLGYKSEFANCCGASLQLMNKPQFQNVNTDFTFQIKDRSPPVRGKTIQKKQQQFRAPTRNSDVFGFRWTEHNCNLKEFKNKTVTQYDDKEVYKPKKCTYSSLADNGSVVFDPASGCCVDDKIVLSISFDKFRVTNMTDAQIKANWWQNLPCTFSPALLGDVTFVVEDVRIAVPKMVIFAHSSVLKEILEGHNKQVNCDGSTGTVTGRCTGNDIVISDFSEAVVQSMVQCLNDPQVLYTEFKAHSVELYAIADKFEMSGIMAAIENYLENSITVETAMSTLQFADLHSNARIKAAVLKCILNNSQAFMHSLGQVLYLELVEFASMK